MIRNQVMKFVYCCEPFSPGKPDPAYTPEVLAAQQAGFSFELIDFEVLTDDGNPDKAVRRVRQTDAPEPAIYRGWMLRPAQYRQLYHALRERGLCLINTPEAYQHCHYLPESYSVIKDSTPLTVSLRLDGNFSMDAVLKLLSVFGAGAVVLKDYVKSRKHE